MSEFSRGLVAAGHQETARAGASILEAGGNAFDAAVAAALASYVAEPSLTSLGGGGFMLAVPTGQAPVLYDFFVQTPRQKRPLAELDLVESQINFGTTSQKQYIGKGTTAVPGCPAGLLQAHEQLGRMPLWEVAQPALDLCRQGVVITPYQAYTLAILEPILLHDAEMRRIFGREDRLIQKNEVMYRPLLAQTIEQLVEEGVAAFYLGEIAQRYARDNAENGGSLTLEDLASYEVITRQPISYKYHRHTLLTNPAPSAGGTMIAYGLAMLKGLPPWLGRPSGEAYVLRLAGAMQGMNEFREGYLETGLPQPDFDPRLYLQEAFVRGQRETIDWLGNTTHISVLDTEGNAASLTSTIGGASGYTIPGTGIPANNMLGELDLNPGGLYAWGENQRLTSMMAPTVALHDGQPAIVLGSGGSSRIRTALMQVLLNLIDHGMDVAEAVRYPRIHWEAGILNLEPGFIPDVLSFKPKDTLLTYWEAPNMFFGGVHTVVRDPGGQLHGAADHRRDGAVKGA